MDERLKKLRDSSHLFPAPGNGVVRQLIDEIELLQQEVKQRDEFVNKQIAMLMRAIQQCTSRSDRWLALTNEQNRLIAVHDESCRISIDLRLDFLESHPDVADDWDRVVVTEFDPDSGVPMLPIPEFCRLYSCVTASSQENWEGGKHNCIGDETRRLVKNENGFWVCPTCRMSYGTGD